MNKVLLIIAGGVVLGLVYIGIFQVLYLLPPYFEEWRDLGLTP